MDFATLHRWDIPVIAGMILLGLASILIGYWLRGNRAKASRIAASWPAADGVIMTAQVEHERNSDGPDDYVARVRYSYSVGLQRREGDCIRAGGATMFRNESAAQIAIAPYRPGERILVRYDPQRPDRSVLEIAPAPDRLRDWVIFGVFLILSAAYALVTVLFPDLWN